MIMKRGMNEIWYQVGCDSTRMLDEGREVALHICFGVVTLVGILVGENLLVVDNSTI